MDSGDAIRLLCLLIFLCFSAFFSASETALTAVSKIRIKTLANEGDKNAAIVEKMLDNQTRLISVLLIGNNIVNTGLTALATVIVTETFGSRAVGALTAVITVLILIFGEITPKNCAAISAEKFSLKVARPVYVWMKIATPVSIALDVVVKTIMKILGVDPNWKDTYTETEIRTIVDESHEDGEIEEEEKDMINNVFDLGESTAKDVMVPRVDMVFLSADATFEETMALYRECMYTRLPVYEDDSNDVIGIFNVKDILLSERGSEFSVRSLMREAYYTHEYKNASELMQEMLKNGISIAIVLDEYGDTAGLVTMEDMLEEIVGDIYDEYDDDERDNIQEIGERSYLAEGSANLDDLCDRIPGFEIESEEFDSIGGIIIGILDRMPEDGDEVVTDGGIRLRVVGVDHNRIEKVQITMPEAASETDRED